AQIKLEKTPNDIANGDNPRMAAGIKTDGSLVLVAVDGRGGGDAGLTQGELGYVFDWLGCPVAINLDVGRSATLYTNVPQLQEALGFKRDNKLIDTKVMDTRGSVPRTVHHAVVLQLDVAKLIPNPEQVFEGYRVTSPYGMRLHPVDQVMRLHRG